MSHNAPADDQHDVRGIEPPAYQGFWWPSMPVGSPSAIGGSL